MLAASSASGGRVRHGPRHRLRRGRGQGAAAPGGERGRARAVGGGPVRARPARGQDERVEWVWLLHDDCEPGADALEQLLRGAAETPPGGGARAEGHGLVGPGRACSRPALTIDTVGRRITGIEPREVDQGQHDGDRDTLAVGSAGMLVRRDVWDQLARLRPRPGPVPRGHRLLLAGARGRATGSGSSPTRSSTTRRPSPGGAGRCRSAAAPQLLDRRNALLTLAGNLPLRPMLESLAGNVPCRSCARCSSWSPSGCGGAGRERRRRLGAAATRCALLRVRSMRARGRKAAYGRLRADIPPGRSLRRMAEFVAAMFATGQQDTRGSHHATEDPDEADDFLLTDTGIAQRILTNPGVLLFIAPGGRDRGRRAVAARARARWAAAPCSRRGGAASVWHQYLLGFHPTGVGSPSTSPAYLAILALLATVLTGKAWLAVDVILLGCVPIAGLTAYFAIRRVTASVAVRIWVAATYALIPVAAGAIAAGRVGTAAAFALIPLIGLQAGRMFSQPPRIARRAAWATGLVTAVAAAFVPMVWLIALLAGVVAAAMLRRGRRLLINIGHRRGRAGRAADPVDVPARGAPVRTAARGRRPAARPGQPAPGDQVADAAQPRRSRPAAVLGHRRADSRRAGGAAGVARRRLLVLAGWTVAVVGLLVAIPASRLSVRPAVGGPAVTAWPGAALAITAAGLLLAAAAGSDGLRTAVSGGRTGARRMAGGRGVAFVLLAVIGCSAPVAAGAFWVRHGVDGPVGAARGQIVPALVSDDAVSSAQVRTLILSTQGSGVSYQLLRGTGLNLGDAELAPVPAAESALRTAVAALAAPGGGQAVDQAQALARFDIGFVLMRAPVDPTLARSLDAVTGLRPVSMTASFDLWRLATMPSRVSVLENNGAVVPVASGPVNVSGATAPAAGGTLLLAEPAGGWQATLNGHALTAVPSPAGSWAQAFRLPSGGGTLDISRSELGHELALALELLAALVVAALALPGVRSTAEAAAGAEAGAGAGAAHRGKAVRLTRTAILARVRVRARVPAGCARRAWPGRGRDDGRRGLWRRAGRPRARREPRGGRAGADWARDDEAPGDRARDDRARDDRARDDRAGGGRGQADGGRFDDGRLDGERLDLTGWRRPAGGDRRDEARRIGWRGQADGGRRRGGRAGGRGGKGRLRGRGLGRRSKQAGPDSPAQPGEPARTAGWGRRTGRSPANRAASRRCRAGGGRRAGRLGPRPGRGLGRLGRARHAARCRRAGSGRAIRGR